MYLDIDPRQVKFAGAGAKLQWAMAIGIGVDQFVHELNKRATDEELLTNIRAQLTAPALERPLSDPLKYDTAQKEAINAFLRGAGTKLTVDDLHRVLSETR